MRVEPTTLSERIRVVVLDANASVREATATFVEASEDMELAGEGAGRTGATCRHIGGSPDVVLVGMTLRESSAIQAIAATRRRWPETRVIAMGSFQEEGLRQAALAAGAVDYVLKHVSADELAAAFRAAYTSRRGTETPALMTASG